MQKSEAINEIALAMSKAQGSFSAAERAHVAKVVSKKGEGSSYSYNYADLAAYLDVCRGPLAENSLSFVQSVSVADSKATVTTMLLHGSGQWIEFDPLSLCAENLTPQSIGSAITYARRYALSAAIGMASEADDDGNAAQGNDAETARRAELPPCPQCKTNKSVIAGKPEYGGGFVCFGKKGGCGAKWQAEAPPAVEQPGEPPAEEKKPAAKKPPAKPAPPNPPIPEDKEGNFDWVGYMRKKIGIENTAAGLDAALAELKKNKDNAKDQYAVLLREWFARAIDTAADNERVRSLDKVLAAARPILGEDAFVKLGVALDEKYQKEAAA